MNVNKNLSEIVKTKLYGCLRWA